MHAAYGVVMVTDDRLEDIKKDMLSAPEFFMRIHDVICRGGEVTKDLVEDLEAAEEFFSEMLSIVHELESYRRAIMPVCFSDYRDILHRR